MRKIVCLFVAVSTFAFGVGAYFLWFYFIPVPVSLCDLARHPDWYDGRVVRVAAPASSFYGFTMIVDEGCALDESAAVIMQDKGYIPTPEMQAFLADSGPLIKKADVVVVGRFDKHATMGCFSPKFGIVATDIELKHLISYEHFTPSEE